MAHPVVQRSNSRRRPYPYDMYIGETKVILEPGSDGNLVAQKTKTLDATAPVDFTYSSANPFKERTFEWIKLYGGYGQFIEDQQQRPHRIEHAEFVDTSVNGMMFKGPKFESHVETITGAGEIRQLIVSDVSGSNIIFAICQNGIWSQAPPYNGTWLPSLLRAGTSPVLPAGCDPQSAIRFRSNQPGPPPVYGVNSLYVAASTGNLWRHDGFNWTIAAVAEGPGTGTTDGQARYLERIGDELWVAGDYWVVKTDIDSNPMLRANWAGVIWIGDLTARITGLKQINNTLYIFKEDGIYTLSDTGVDQEILPTLRGNNSLTNGKNAAVWMDRMWVPYGDQTFMVDAEGTFRPDGMEQVLENQSDVRGKWVAGAGHNTWFMYEFYYNNLTADSYMIKHGTWVEATESGASVPGLAEFADAHHGALYSWENKRVTTAEVISGVHPNGNDRLYVGFANGTIEWCVLPQTSPNPLVDPGCEFTTHESIVYLPVHHMGYQADNKLYRGISAVGPRLTNTEWIEVQYKFDTVDPFASWITVDPANPRFTLPNDRKEFPNNTYGRSIKMRILLKAGAIGTPAIDGIAVHQALRPSLALEWVFSVKLASHLAKHNGTTDRRRGSQLREEVQEACAYPGNTLITLPTGEEELMTLIDYRESAANWTKRRDHEWLAQITGIQLRTLSKSEPGFTGMTYATLEQYTVGELESII